MCWSRLQRWRTGVYGCGGVRHDLSLPVSVQAREMCNIGEWWWMNYPRPVADTVVLSPRYDVVRERAVSPTVHKLAAFLRRHRFRYCRQNGTTSATPLNRRRHKLHLRYN